MPLYQLSLIVRPLAKVSEIFLAVFVWIGIGSDPGAWNKELKFWKRMRMNHKNLSPRDYRQTIYGCSVSGRFGLGMERLLRTANRRWRRHFKARKPRISRSAVHDETIRWTKMHYWKVSCLIFIFRSYASNLISSFSYMLVDFYAPESTKTTYESFIRQNADVVHHYIHQPVPNPPLEECSLYEELKPPAYRKSVQELRANKKMDKLSRWIAVLNARNLAKREPKSYFIPPFRE